MNNDIMPMTATDTKSPIIPQYPPFPLSGVTTVLFDLDDTLLDRDQTFYRFSHHLTDDHLADYIPSAQRKAAVSFLMHNDQRGYAPRNELFQAFVDTFHLPLSAHRLETYWFEHFDKYAVPVGKLINVLTELSVNYDLGIITNGASSMQHRKIDMLKIRNFFKVIVISDEVKMCKPDPAIFIYTCEALGIEPYAAVFVGDHYQNDVRGAMSAGMRAIWINPPSEQCEYPYTVNTLSDVRCCLKK